MERPKEPQRDVDIDEEVNRLKGHPNSQRGDFYESRHDSEIDENAPPGNVNTQPGGAKRLSYFRDRDYKP